jgi:hypothetical protein
MNCSPTCRNPGWGNNLRASAIFNSIALILQTTILWHLAAASSPLTHSIAQDTTAKPISTCECLHMTTSPSWLAHTPGDILCRWTICEPNLHKKCYFSYESTQTSKKSRHILSSQTIVHDITWRHAAHSNVTRRQTDKCIVTEVECTAACVHNSYMLSHDVSFTPMTKRRCHRIDWISVDLHTHTSKLLQRCWRHVENSRNMPLLSGRNVAAFHWKWAEAILPPWIYTLETY